MSTNTINDIAHFYKGKNTDISYEDFSVEEKSIVLEDHLLNICESLAEANKLTEDKNVNIEYLLTIVGSYLMGVQEGTLDVTSTEPPSKLFEESLYPSIEAAGIIDTEVIEEDEQLDYNSDSADIEGYAAEETPDLRA